MQHIELGKLGGTAGIRIDALANARKPRENLRIGVVAERGGYLRIELLGGSHMLDCLHVRQFRRESVHQPGQLVLFSRQRNDRIDLWEIGVGRRSREQLELLIATIGILIEQPRPLAAARSHATSFPCPGPRPGVLL